MANAVAQLLSILHPEGLRPVPVGGGIAKHSFREAFARQVYTSGFELQGHINNVPLTNLACFHVLIDILMFEQVLRMIRSTMTVDFSSEQLIFYYSDIIRGNFPFGKDD